MPLLRKSCLCLLGAVLAASVLTTGCQSAQPAQTASQPAQDETVIYNKWEVSVPRRSKKSTKTGARSNPTTTSLVPSGTSSGTGDSAKFNRTARSPLELSLPLYPCSPSSRLRSLSSHPDRSSRLW
jgi:hypothetical protein